MPGQFVVKFLSESRKRRALSMRSLHSNAGILEQYLRVRAIRETSAFTVKGSHNIGSGSPTLRLYLEEREVDSVSVPQPLVPELPFEGCA